MKKNKLFTLSLAALMTIGMAACGGSVKPFDYGTVDAEKMTLTRNAVTEISIGEEIDIADNVKITPEDVKWNVVPVDGYEGIVAINGTKIKGIKAGHFKVRIVAGPSQLGKIYEGDVISQAIKDARALFASLDDDMNYTASLLTAKEADKYEDRLLTMAFHNEDYFGFINEDGNYEGMMRSGKGHTLNYEYNNAKVDATTHLPANGTLVVNKGYYSDLSLYPFGTPMGFTESEIVENDDVDGIVLDFDSDSFETLVNVTLGVEFAALVSEVGNIKTATLEYTPKTDAAAHIYFGDKSGSELCELLIENIGSTNIKEVDTYIASKAEPELEHNTAFNTAIGAINAAKNFTIEGSISVGSYNKNGAWVESTNRTVLTNMEENWGITPAAFTAKVDGENYLSTDGAGNYSLYAPNGGSLNYVAGTETDGVITWDEPQAMGIDSVWTEGIAIEDSGYIAPAAFVPVDLAGEELDAICWTEIETTSEGTVASASPYGDSGYFCALTMAMVPELGSGIAWMFSTLYSEAYPTAVWYDFMDATEAKVANNGEVTLATSLSGMIQVGSSVYGVRFEVSFKNIGTTASLASTVSAAFGA